MTNLIIVISAIVSYLIGSISSAILLSRAISGEDIRNSGSGNAGATNMLRTHGKGMGVLTLILDVLKGVVVVFAAKGLVSMAAFPEALAGAVPYICAVACILGHNFPLYFKFKGGKGVATSIGAVLVLDWQIGLIVAAAALTVMAVTRYVSLGSILGAAAYVVAALLKMIFTRSFNEVTAVCICIIGLMLIVRHSSNIVRLLKGTENKLGKKKEEVSADGGNKK